MTTTIPCIDPAAITDDEIIAFAFGEAGLQTQHHIDQCLHCRTEAHSFAELGQNLLQDTHPASIKLAELAMKMLTPQEELIVQAHVRSCASCREDSDVFSDLLAQDDIPVPTLGLGSALRRIIAQLQAPISPAMGGLRGSDAGASKTYEAEDDLFVIGVEVRPAGRGGAVITGLQVPSPDSSATASLYNERGEFLQAGELNEVGTFSFDGVRAGRYQVEVASQARIVVIESVEVA